MEAETRAGDDHLGVAARSETGFVSPAACASSSTAATFHPQTTPCNFVAATWATLLLAARTDYRMDAAAGWRSGSDPADTVAAEVNAAAAKPEAQLRAADICATTRPFSTGSHSNWDDQAQLARSTPERLADRGQGTPDPDLEGTLFQYGRYLLMGSSRPATCPPTCRESGTIPTSRPGPATTTATSTSR